MEDRYRKIRKIGEGGSSVIYQVWDNHLCQKKAMKCLSFSGKNMELLERVQNEIPVLRELHQAGFPRLTDVYWDTEGLNLVMDYIEGETLLALIEGEGAMEKERGLDLFLQTARLVKVLHEKSPAILHGDIQPSNLILKEGRIWLLDFGAGGRETMETGFEEEEGKIESGGTLFTRGFSAPELLGGAALTRQSDIYSLGCLLYYLLTGRRPDEGGDEEIKQGNPSVISVRKRDPFVGKGVDRLIRKCTAKQPEHRFRSIGELLTEAYREKGEPQNPLKRWWRRCFRFMKRREEEPAPIRLLLLTEGEE